MVWLRVICLLLGTFAVLALTPLSASASPAVETPCHSTESRHQPSPAQPDKPMPDKPMKAMGCCIVCTTACLTDRVTVPVDLPVATIVAPALTLEGHGLLTGPEPGPPRI